ncbi:MAG: FG-GAP repeat protein [Planctomycetales bacterium]|nr:FG-GAP repeat protein [Planctomycetales bacterium]
MMNYKSATRAESGAPVLRNEIASFTAGGIQPQDWFGSSISGFADRLVVGAYGKGDAGAAYLFERSDGQWIETRQFLPSDPNVISFGGSVAISSEWTVIGAPDARSQRPYPGTVFTYAQDGQESIVRPASQQDVDRFGSGVAIDQSTLVVGARGTDRRGNQSGSAYVFERQGEQWVEVTELLPSLTNRDSNFGVSIDISGERIIGGATYLSGGVGGGQAFVFEKVDGEWVEQAELSLITPGFTDAYGRSVAINDRFAVVGAPGNLGRRNDYLDGAVFIYEKGESGWEYHQTLTPFPGVGARSQFGTSVAIDDQWLLVGARANKDEGVNSGSGYLFRLDGDSWEPSARLTTHMPLNAQALGVSAYIGDDFLMLGAPSLSTAVPSVGYVQVFAVPEPGASVHLILLSLASFFYCHRNARMEKTHKTLSSLDTNPFGG